jgi:beta-glucanase (GH16 family)
MDESPWVLPPTCGWLPAENRTRRPRKIGRPIVESAMTTATEALLSLAETFPGNLAAFERDHVRYSAQGAELMIDVAQTGVRPYRSGAFSSARTFTYGRFEAEIRAAPGSGLVTGFFLHRAAPRQEIDIEFTGTEPDQMLVNVYFNPGDEGAALGYGYRGAPWRVALGFDATADFHHYAIEWRHDSIAWLVDHRVVHERVGWDPTPIPHLGMRLHGNLWAPRSEELAGRVDRHSLPAYAVFRDLRVTT